ncbi:hypothetical protein [Polymorphospora rubra]|uniref:hypothetical protein n=1 Tax=Polymorphospora rubra TaxID=338584 RepID=UPI001BB3FB5A|nr:hypothetical protein [Polymorphospora rubra]
MAGKQSNRLVVEHEQVVGVDYSVHSPTGLVGVGARFERCRFDGLRFQNVAFGSGMELSQYVECSFDGAVLTGAAGYSRFVGCTFRGAEIRDLTADYLELIDCVFTGRIRSTTFWAPRPQAPPSVLRATWHSWRSRANRNLRDTARSPCGNPMRCTATTSLEPTWSASPSATASI